METHGETMDKMKQLIEDVVGQHLVENILIPINEKLLNRENLDVESDFLYFYLICS